MDADLDRFVVGDYFRQTRGARLETTVQGWTERSKKILFDLRFDLFIYVPAVLPGEGAESGSPLLFPHSYSPFEVESERRELLITVDALRISFHSLHKRYPDFIPPSLEQFDGLNEKSKSEIDEAGRQLQQTLSEFFSRADFLHAEALFAMLFGQNADRLEFVPKMNILILIIGTRGDVQPFVALGRKLQEVGHRCRLATHACFKDFVLEHDLEFFPIGGDPRELIAYMVRNPGLIPKDLSEVPKKRKMMHEMFLSMWPACIQDDPDTGKKFMCEAIISNPPSFAHIHIAERLNVPCHIYFTMPWTPTTAFPHPLCYGRGSSSNNPYENYLSYKLVDNLQWMGLSDIINDFRTNTLGLEPIAVEEGAASLVDYLKTPVAYCWSPGLVPRPNDWGSHIDITGFFFLSAPADYVPPEELRNFLDAGPPPFYFGFGSIVVEGIDKLMLNIFRAIRKTGIRALVNKGWSEEKSTIKDEDVPDTIMFLGNCPHDWLFPQCAAVCHHGGAGTTATGLWAGRPTIVVPFFGDQFWWGDMVHRRGAGPQAIHHSMLTEKKMVKAIEFCLKETTQTAAQQVAASIRSEDGVAEGVAAFHRQLPLDLLTCEVCLAAIKSRTAFTCEINFGEDTTLDEFLDTDSPAAHPVQAVPLAGGQHRHSADKGVGACARGAARCSAGGTTWKWEGSPNFTDLQMFIEGDQGGAGGVGSPSKDSCPDVKGGQEKEGGVAEATTALVAASSSPSSLPGPSSSSVGASVSVTVGGPESNGGARGSRDGTGVGPGSPSAPPGSPEMGDASLFRLPPESETHLSIIMSHMQKRFSEVQSLNMLEGRGGTSVGEGDDRDGGADSQEAASSVDRSSPEVPVVRVPIQQLDAADADGGATASEAAEDVTSEEWHTAAAGDGDGERTPRSAMENEEGDQGSVPAAIAKEARKESNFLVPSHSANSATSPSSATHHQLLGDDRLGRTLSGSLGDLGNFPDLDVPTIAARLSVVTGAAPEGSINTGGFQSAASHLSSSPPWAHSPDPRAHAAEREREEEEEALKPLSTLPEVRNAGEVLIKEKERFSSGLARGVSSVSVSRRARPSSFLGASPLTVAAASPPLTTIRHSVEGGVEVLGVDRGSTSPISPMPIAPGVARFIRQVGLATVYDEDADLRLCTLCDFVINRSVAQMNLPEHTRREYRAVDWTWRRKKVQVKNLRDGVSRGIATFAESLRSGVQGIVTSPLTGLRSGGYSGAVIGVGVGVANLIVQPIVGSVRLLEHSSRGAMLSVSHAATSVANIYHGKKKRRAKHKALENAAAASAPPEGEGEGEEGRTSPSGTRRTKGNKGKGKGGGAWTRVKAAGGEGVTVEGGGSGEGGESLAAEDDEDGFGSSECSEDSGAETEDEWDEGSLEKRLALPVKSGQLAWFGGDLSDADVPHLRRAVEQEVFDAYFELVRLKHKKIMGKNQSSPMLMQQNLRGERDLPWEDLAAEEEEEEVSGGKQGEEAQAPSSSSTRGREGHTEAPSSSSSSSAVPDACGGAHPHKENEKKKGVRHQSMLRIKAPDDDDANLPSKKWASEMALLMPLAGVSPHPRMSRDVIGRPISPGAFSDSSPSQRGLAAGDLAVSAPPAVAGASPFDWRMRSSSGESSMSIYVLRGGRALNPGLNTTLNRYICGDRLARRHRRRHDMDSDTEVDLSAYQRRSQSMGRLETRSFLTQSVSLPVPRGGPAGGAHNLPAVLEEGRRSAQGQGADGRGDEGGGWTRASAPELRMGGAGDGGEDSPFVMVEREKRVERARANAEELRVEEARGGVPAGGTDSRRGSAARRCNLM
uniref:Uncharacterized protein n=1 Tax=Chromera velia CCMP2878 TaxID=1169474 RepID=A0A0G4I0H6_9ALVE|eukprot:Cvel_1627.t1-p1 / transcript=Cvel_1627.t1 / gene=Cvel_1627 / organism=Chromera_velia_CCMP2878 / gene_product=Sterol 3-beta-glucosyltransferase UGT80A2, putative / transcript_product=Sterol 3-beta-glucosyltransferase UGT80A2, putative / location=Cvel_scaffold58:64858-75449(+) / protein_length=1803 / sequence_SO=supercontig / SO=protein_coding / is_pseudo=false